MLVRGLLGAVTFVGADALDRYLAGYDPSAATKPSDRFTSDGAGSLANTLNIASPPDAMRVGAAVGFVALPAVGLIFVEEPLARSGLEGALLGGGIHLAKMAWNNFLMPLLAPKDVSPASLQKSIVCRLYPAEVAAKINIDAHQTAVSSAGSGALSAPQLGTGGDSPFPSAADALRRAAGVGDDGYPSAADELRRAAGVGAVEQAINDMTKTIVQAVPGAHPAAAVQAAAAAIERPHDVFGTLTIAFPHVPATTLLACARQLLPNVTRLHAAAANSQPLPVITPPSHGTGQPPSYTPGPPPGQGPGPKFDHEHGDGCGCGVASVDLYGGFLGAPEDDDDVSPLWTFDRVTNGVARTGGRRSDDR